VGQDLLLNSVDMRAAWDGSQGLASTLERPFEAEQLIGLTLSHNAHTSTLSCELVRTGLSMLWRSQNEFSCAI
jgi:hypothetical protein